MRRFEPSEETLKLIDLFSKAEDGSYWKYEDIERATDVVMDNKGKERMRSALNHLKQDYRVERAEGIELAGVKNVMHITTNKTERVRSAIKNADKTSGRLFVKFYDQLPDPDRQRMAAVASLLGAVSAMSAGLKKLYPEPPKLENLAQDVILPPGVTKPK